MYQTTTIFPGLRAMPNTLISSAFSTTHVTRTMTATTTVTETTSATVGVAIADAPRQTAANSYAADIINRMVGSATAHAYNPLRTAALTLPGGWEEYAPIVKWVLTGAVLGAGTMGTAQYLYSRYRRAQVEPPIPEGEDPIHWKACAKVTGFLFKKCLRSNVELQRALEEAQDHAALLQQAVDNETRLREEAETKANTARSTPRQDQELEPVDERNTSQRRVRFRKPSGSGASPADIPLSTLRSSGATPTMGSTGPSSNSSRIRSSIEATPAPNRDPQLAQFIKDQINASVEKLTAGALSQDEFVRAVDRQIQKYKFGGDGTPPSKSKRKAGEAFKGEETSTLVSGKAKRKVDETEIESGGTAYEPDEYDGMIGMTTPEVNQMDPKWRAKNALQKINFEDMPKLQPNTERAAKRARSSNTSSMGKANGESTGLRRSPRKSKAVVGSMDERKFSRRPRSPHK